jgi:hypothetical protein
MSDLRDNPHLLPFYASRKCRDCYGRGERTLNVRNEATGFQWVEAKVLCPCVTKAVQKEIKELAGHNG